MSDDFKRVKDALNIKQVIMASSGLAMKRKHLEECPFCHGHECFSIMDDHRQAYKCHQCGAGGDVFTFFENFEGLDKRGSLDKAADLAGIELKAQSRSRAVEMTIKERIFKDAAAYYNEQVLAGPGKAYFVDQRGHDERLLKDMHLGFADGKLHKHLAEKNYSIEDLASCGLVQKMDKGNGKGPQSQIRDYFPKGVAIFPHFDAKGRVLHFTQKDADPVRSKDPEKKVKWQLKKEHTDKDWRFYNQKAIKGDEVILVEGENDLLAIMSAGHRNVMAIIGQISDIQLKALQDNLKHKELYIWLDRDGKADTEGKLGSGGKAGQGGHGFTEKICKALRAAAYKVRVIDHPGDAKDPDEYLKGISGDPRKEVQRLLEQSITYVGWQLKRVGELKQLDEIIRELKARKIFSTIASMPRLDRLPYIEGLKLLGLDEETIKEQLEVNRELRDALGTAIADAGGIQKVDPYAMTRIIYEHLEANGKFFRDREHNVYLLYQNKIYEISNNRPFNALMDRSGGLLVNRAPGPQVWEALANRGYNFGTRIDVASWLATKQHRGCIYVNFNSADNTILKISAAGIEEVPNGLNEDDVLLKSSDRIEPMEFNQGTSIREGLETLRELVLDNMTCDIEQRYLIICWMISAFMLDFMPYQAIMKFSGGTSSGKTTAAKLLSMVLYGKEQLGHVSSAAAYSLSSQNPLVILDNLEAEDRGKALKMFLLLAATGGSKEKRAGGTDSDTVQEKPKSLVLITAIEPLEEPELINRTLDIQFHKSHRTDGFMESLLLMSISRERNNILSALMKLISRDILPELDEGLRANLTILKDEYKGHSKDRADEYMALLMLILRKILPHMPFAGKDDFTANPAEIWRLWIDYQNKQARDDEIQSNSILRMLDGLASEYVNVMRGGKYEEDPTQPGLSFMEVRVFRKRHDMYLLEAEMTQPQQRRKDQDGLECEPYYLSYISFTATSSELVAAMSSWCREKGIRNPYDNAARFTKRLQNDKETLRRAGWTLEAKDSLGGLYSKVIRGQRFITLRKELVR